jgi:erythromycin esterase-like protein
MTALVSDVEVRHALVRSAHPLLDRPDDYAHLLRRLGHRRFVLIGEASHGTHEFYRERARITRDLIRSHGVTAVVIEGDWPDAARVNRYVLGASDDPDARSALSGFRRFPAWMWRNRDVLAFVEWLRRHNDAQGDPERKVRFHGMDLYSLQASIAAVLEYLDRTDPAEAARARARYACIEDVEGGQGASAGDAGQRYGHAVAYRGKAPCEDEAVAQLRSLRARAAGYLARDGATAEDEQFYAEQNARLVQDAEEYYHQMYRADVSSWNLRDAHMTGTLDALLDHLERGGGPARIAVWAHNSHLGDARATGMGYRGEWNVGQLLRQRYGNDVALIGMTTSSGEVTAATHWGDDPQRKQVRPARPDSYEGLFHAVGLERCWLDLSVPDVRDALAFPRLERFIGVIYRPETELVSHYAEARIADQFDAVVHIDRTGPVVPLERSVRWDLGEPPETFPTGL